MTLQQFLNTFRQHVCAGEICRGGLVGDPRIRLRCAFASGLCPVTALYYLATGRALLDSKFGEAGRGLELDDATTDMIAHAADNGYDWDDQSEYLDTELLACVRADLMRSLKGEPA